MQDGTKFSHITVSSDDEDDIVIQAGVLSPSRSRQSDASFSEEVAESLPEEPAIWAHGTSCEVGDFGKIDPSIQDEGSEERALSSSSEREKHRKVNAIPKETSSAEGCDASSNRVGYHETTIDDLKNTPMSRMQKVVIAAALLFIVAFIVYCVFFMRA